MAIRIEHGGRGSDAAGQILAQAGQGEANRQSQEMQALLRLAGAARPGPDGGGGGGGGGSDFDEKAMAIRKLNAQRAMQTEQIQAKAQRDTKAADDATAKIAMKFGLDEQVAEQEFQNKLRAKREEANEWEVNWSPKQLQEISRRNQSNQEIASKLQGGEISQEEAEVMTAGNNTAIDNMVPSRRPADPNRWKGDPAKAPGQGLTWKDEEGNTMTTQENGEPKLVLQYRQSREYQAKELEAREAEKQAALVQGRKDAEEERYHKRLLEAEKRLWDTDKVTMGKDGDGNPKEIHTQPTSQQVSADLAAWQQANPTPEQQRQIEQQLEAQRQQAAAAAADDAEFERRVAAASPGTKLQTPDGRWVTKRKQFAPSPFAAGRLTE